MIYGFIGLVAGRRYARPVLSGALSWQKTTLIAFVALVLDSIYYIVFHRGLSPKSGLHPDFGGALLFLQICVFGPVSEELALQGFVQTRLLRFGVLPALLATTTLFVCMHFTEVRVRPDTADIEHIFFYFSRYF